MDKHLSVDNTGLEKLFTDNLERDIQNFKILFGKKKFDRIVECPKIIEGRSPEKVEEYFTCYLK